MNNKTKYTITVASLSKKTLYIKHVLKKADKSIKRIKTISVQKTSHADFKNNIDYKYLHNFIIVAKPTAELKTIYANTLNKKHILDVSIKLM